MNTTTSATKARLAAVLAAIIGSILLPLALAITGTTAGASPTAAASATDVDGPAPVAIGDGHAVIPDLVVTFPATDDGRADAARVVDRVATAPSIRWAALDPLATTGPAVSVAFVDHDGGAGLRVVDAAVDELGDAEGVTVSGRALADNRIGDRIATGVAVAVLVAALATAALVGWMTGILRGALAGLTIGIVAWLAGAVGGSVTGQFDGSLATTSVPAVMAAIAMSGFLLLRLLLWFGAPSGADQAEMIRQAALSVGLELVLTFAGLGALAFVLELSGDARSVATIVLIGAVTGALLTLAIVCPALAAAHGDGDPVQFRSDPGFDPGRQRLVPIPRGQDFPVGVLVGFGIFLALLAVFSVGASASGQLLDDRAVDLDGGVGAGDRTSAILARFDGDDQGAVEDWLLEASALPEVAFVDTPAARYADGGRIDSVGLVPAEIDRDPGQVGYALVVPGVTGRSTAAIELVDAIEAIDPALAPELSGVPVDARAAEDVGRWQILGAIVALAVLGAVSVLVIIGDPTTAAIAGGLRFVALLSVAGAYRLLAGPATGAEVLLVLLVVAMAIGLFELGYARRLLASNSGDDTDAVLERALNIEGGAATMALGLVILASFGLLASDLAVMRRLGTLLAVTLLIQVAIVVWLLLPTLVGARAVRHFASKPVQAALATLTGTSTTSRAEHRAWVDVVAQLLFTEFTFHRDPAAADVDAVFVPGTMLHTKSTEHHRSLTGAGLRIVGRQPQLRALRVVDNSAPATLLVTVDHPGRQLIGVDDKVVGVRRAERRSVMLWMNLRPDGSYRIADSVELGSVPLGEAEEAVAAPAAVPASTD